MTWGFVTCGPNEALVVSGKMKTFSAKKSREKIDNVRLSNNHILSG